MDPKIKELLEEETLPENLLKLSAWLNDNHKRSRGVMSKRYKQWDRNISTYRGEFTPEEQDYNAQNANEPDRAVVPLSYAQINTFTSFGFLLLTQNQNFYNYAASGDEDYPLKEIIEQILQRDLKANKLNSLLYQFLLDLPRCGIAPLKHWWTVDTATVDVVTPESEALARLGYVSGETLTSMEAIRYEGNRVANISPYKFLPDCRQPLSKWSEGQFVADEDEIHITNLKRMERMGIVAGTQHVQRMTKETMSARGNARLPNLAKELAGSSSQDASDFMVARTEGNAWIVPAEYGLGPEGYPVLWTYMFANDRLVRLERQGYLHSSFNYELAQFSNDQEATMNECLSDTIHALQNMITWLYNSRMESVRRSLDSHLIVHPMYVDIASLESRSPIVYLTKNAPVNDIRQIVHQLDVRDTTTGHFSDADILRSTMQFVTGVNENAMGQYAQGRRSATEARAVTAGASSRMKVIVTCAFEQAFEPMGAKLLSNSRQGLSEESFVKIVGESKRSLYPLYAPSDPLALIGNEDFFVMDTTLAAEKGYIAQSLQELIITMINNPELAMTSGFDLEKAVKEIQYLRGVTHATRFFTKSPVQMGLGATPGGAQVPGGVLPVQGA